MKVLVENMKKEMPDVEKFMTNKDMTLYQIATKKFGTDNFGKWNLTKAMLLPINLMFYPPGDARVVSYLDIVKSDLVNQKLRCLQKTFGISEMEFMNTNMSDLWKHRLVGPGIEWGHIDSRF